MVFLKDEIKLTGALFRYVVNTADYLDLSEIFHLGVLQLRCWRLYWVIILFLHFKNRIALLLLLACQRAFFFEHKVKFKIQSSRPLAATARLH